jgi:hypothetical protein
MPQSMSEKKQIECQKECQSICQKVCQHRCQIERQNNYANYAIYTSRWYVRNYVRIVVQGGDHSKESNWTSNNQKDGNQNNWQWACLYNCDVYVWRIKARNLLRIIVMYIRFSSSSYEIWRWFLRGRTTSSPNFFLTWLDLEPQLAAHCLEYQIALGKHWFRMGSIHDGGQ